MDEDYQDNNQDSNNLTISLPSNDLTNSITVNENINIESEFSQNQNNQNNWRNWANNIFKKPGESTDRLTPQQSRSQSFKQPHNPLTNLPSPNLQNGKLIGNNNGNAITTNKSMKRSKSWFFRHQGAFKNGNNKNNEANYKSTSHSPVELVISSSTNGSVVEIDANNHENDLQQQLIKLKLNDNSPILLGCYNGSPVYSTFITKNDNIYLFKSKLFQYGLFDKFDEPTYHPWNVWKYDKDNYQKKLIELIESKSDFKKFFNRIFHLNLKFIIMRSCLVPDYGLFKNGYLIKLKTIQEGKRNDELIAFFRNCCERILFTKLNENKLMKITVVGVTIENLDKVSQIMFWIHPILNMSFDILNQTIMLLKTFNFNVKFTSICLIDINTNSKFKIDPEEV
ncbi:unnamed protein product [Candida verbasci]|uniref:Uncharacterized protein n=1 Tax=Candida verbasci TaxID=1227364 RepID=A0A9W4XI98_9ASCO|nr:unnamed protein product [Candida verbasci]